MISIHVPREGHDVKGSGLDPADVLFQSTCPARGTTQSADIRAGKFEFQSTCPARGTTF